MITRLNVVASVIFVTVFLSKSSSAQSNQFPDTPCPDVFQYTRSGNIIIGLITVTNVHYGETTVAIELSQPGSINSKDPGHLSLNFNNDKVFEHLRVGKPFTYRVDFPLQNIIPRVTSIQVNGVNICSGPGYNLPSISMMRLEHTLNAFSSQNAPQPQQSEPNNIGRRSSPWQNFGQSSQMTPNTPGFLKLNSFFSPETSDLPPSLFHQPSFNSSPRNQPSYQPPSSFLQHSFDSPPPYQPPKTSQSSFNQASSYPSTLNQPSSTTPFSFNQPSSNLSPHYPSSFNNPSLNPSSFRQHAFNFESVPQPSFNSPSFLKYAFPSFDQSGFEKPLLGQLNNSQPGFEKPLLDQFGYNQQNSEFAMNPQNPFLNKLHGTNNNGSPGAVSHRNPPSTVDRFPTPQQTVLSTPTTINKPLRFTPTLPLKLDPTNLEPTTTPMPSTTRNTITTTTKTTQTPTTTTTEKPHSTLEYINSLCGRENLNNDINSLNVNAKGRIISKARFPWIVAVFKKSNNDDDPKFQCGGSLISTRTIVSAAHCFYSGFEVMRPEDIMISMGRHNLSNTLDALDVDVEKIIPHPDYRPRLTNFDADLAIVRLIKSVPFTSSVRPICMWKGNIEARELEGLSGAIVGWGSDGRRSTTTVPTLVKATIVSELTCIRSNDQFISLTSNRTLCAGSSDGSGPCLGDSGNGLMLLNRNKWMLRGTVSATISTPTQACGINQYAIYSDIAMFIEWIQSNMLL